MNPSSPVAVGLSLLLTGCGGESRAKGSVCCRTESTPAGAISGASLYHLRSGWRDQTGRPYALADGRGVVQVVAMIFTRCDYTCPTIVADMKAVESRLEPDSGVRFLLASFDSERDRPEALNAFAAANGLASERWTLLHGDANAVRELAAILGVKYRKASDGGFSHSNQITVLDAEGEIVHRQSDLESGPTPTLSAIRRLLAAER